MAPHPGGGGLVILPHKSWNVWNQDNKAKVAKDEAANAQLIEAKERCRKKVAHEVRFERLTGKSVTKEEEQRRIQEALDNINISDWIKDKSMSEIAQNINNKMEANNGKKPRKKRKHYDMNMSEEEKKYKPRKRHKRNDVSIIEDHYNNKSKFEFDPKQYNKSNTRDSIDHNISTNSSHFSLFDKNDKNPNNKEEKQQNCDYRFKFGGKQMQSRNSKPWYLMTNSREVKRKKLMKPDDIQYSLPKSLRDHNRNTDDLKKRVTATKNKTDPLNVMNKYLKQSKDKHTDSDVQCKSLKKQKKELLREIKRDRTRRCADIDVHKKHKKKRNKKYKSRR